MVRDIMILRSRWDTRRFRHDFGTGITVAGNACAGLRLAVVFERDSRLVVKGGGEGVEKRKASLRTKVREVR